LLPESNQKEELLKRKNILGLAGGLLMITLLAGLLFQMQGNTALAKTHSSQDSFVYTFPPNDLVFPEGIAYQPSTQAFYVGSTNDGTVYRGTVNPHGARTIEPFLPAGGDNRTFVTGMKVDKAGRLFISGGSTGFIWVYDTRTKALLFSSKINQTGGFINDVAIAPDGSAYFTDSLFPFLYRVFKNAQGAFQVERIDLSQTAIQYVAGFNLNGLAISANGKYLITVQSNTGNLFRMDLHTREATQIDTGGATFTSGDGVWLSGQTLYVARNSLNTIVAFKLDEHFTRGHTIGSITDPTFGFTTTMAQVGNRFLVVNSQFNHRGAGAPPPTLPFTISSVRIHPLD
jgi:Cu-Zn family superoxide dismutase